MTVNRQLSFMKACDSGDALIAIDELGKGIFRIDKKNMSAKLLRIIDGIGNQRNLYQGAERYNDEIFFFPLIMNAGNDIIVYHMENQLIEYIDLKKINKALSGDYRPVKRIGNNVWLFPTNLTRDIAIFQLDTRRIEWMTQWKNIVKNIVLDYTDEYAKLWDFVDAGDVFYHAVFRTNYIIGINKRNFNVECFTMPTDIKLGARMDGRNGKLWMAGWGCQEIVSWESDTKKIQRYSIKILRENAPVDNNWIDHILCGKQYLWLIPRHDNKIVKMCYETGECEYIDIFPEKFYLRSGTANAFGMITRNGNIADLYPYFSNIVIHIDLQIDRLLENYEYISLPGEWSEKDIIHYQSHGIYETNRISPDVYMDFYLQTIRLEKKKESGSSIGDRIWKRVNDSGIGRKVK